MNLRVTVLLSAFIATLSTAAFAQTIEDAERDLKAAKAEQARRDAAARVERERRQAAAIANAAKVDPRHPNRFVQSDDGMLRDTQTAIYWSQSDNGSDIDWTGARQYCASRGWKLPSVEELAALYDTGTGTPCGRHTCDLSPLFRLSSPYGHYWSDTANGPAEAWYVYLYLGERNSYDITFAGSLRALCVRRS